jgi:poly(A) polymerase
MEFSEKVTFAKSFLILRTISQFADSCNTKAYVVGGFVRDYLLRKESKDIDIVVEGNGPEFAMGFADFVKIASPSIFPKYGTAQVKFEDTEVEFVGARRESYTRESIKPEVQTGSLRDDIFRRDFTINTLAIHLTMSQNWQKPIITDITERGIRDLLQGIIITPLNPRITFKDDPTRMIRAVRFATKLGFKIDNDTKETIKILAPEIERVPIERIQTEFSKILLTENPSIGINIMRETDLLDILIPELELLFYIKQGITHHKFNAGDHTLVALDYSKKDLIIRLAVLLHDIGKSETFTEEEGKISFPRHEDSLTPEIILRRFKYDNDTIIKVKKIINMHMRVGTLATKYTEKAVRRLIYDTGGLLNYILDVVEADKYGQKEVVPQYFIDFKKYILNFDKIQLEKIKALESPLSGDEIIAILNYPKEKTVPNWGRLYGSKIGQLKKLIIDNILAQNIENTKEAAIKYLSSLPKEILYPEV